MFDCTTSSWMRSRPGPSPLFLASLPQRVLPSLNGTHSHLNWRRGKIIHRFHSDLSASINAASQLGAFDAVVKQMLEDVQERLVYRTHIYIQTDITGYKPAPGDLAYPEKLEMMEVSPGCANHTLVTKRNTQRFDYIHVSSARFALWQTQQELRS